MKANALVALLAVALVGCAAPDERAAEVRTEADQARESVALSDEMIARLKAEYPVLRSEPAPEPRPNGAVDPSAVPERIRGVASERVLQTATGGATFYADKFEGRRTASGIPFRQNQMVAAHRGFPFGTILRVTNLGNERSVNVRVVDRGPFGSAANRQRTMIDLSRRAATQLGFVDAGRAQVRVEVLEWGPGLAS